MLHHIRPLDVPKAWFDMGLSYMLSQAIRHDDLRTPTDVYRELVQGKLIAWMVDEVDGRGVVVTSLEDRPEGRRFWVNYAAGKTGGLKAMRRLMRQLEHIATDMNAHEIRLQGRDWRRVLPDYEATENVARNEIRKVL